MHQQELADGKIMTEKEAGKFFESKLSLGHRRR